MSTFINLSNHPSKNWSEAQLSEAQKIGDIIDISFPSIDPDDSIEEIQNKASSIFSLICNFEDPVVMVQGEFTLTYQLVRMLQDAKIRSVVSTQKRVSKEYIDANGNTVKTANFHFEGFRNYYI